MKERLDKFIKTEGLTPSRFAEIMGVQPSSISHILGGRNKPSYDFIEKFLLRFPKVNPDWLILGKGQIYRPQSGEFGISDSQRVERAEKAVPDSEVVNNNIMQKPVSSDTVPDLFTPGKAPSVNNIPDLPDATSQQQPQQAPQPSTQKNSTFFSNVEEADIERVVIFLKNKTFASYTPE